MLLGTHRTDVCRCGIVQYDCECPGPKEERVVRTSCDVCKDQPAREAIGPDRQAKLLASTPTEVHNDCLDELDAANNRAIRLAVFDIIGDLQDGPLPNPQRITAEVHQRVEVLPRWTQLVRDLVQEAIGEESIKRRVRFEQESLVKVMPDDWEAQVAAEVDAVMRDFKGFDGRGGEPLQSRIVRQVMQRLGGRAEPLMLHKLVAARLKRAS